MTFLSYILINASMSEMGLTASTIAKAYQSLCLQHKPLIYFSMRHKPLIYFSMLRLNTYKIVTKFIYWFSHTDQAMLKKLLVWHCRPGGSQGGSVDRIFFFYITKKSWKFLLQIRLKCKLNCLQKSPMIYSDTTVFLRIACSNTKHLCRSRYLKQ